MAEATIEILRKTGATPTNTDIKAINTRLQADDTHTTAGSDNPIEVPDSGVNYSYWATMRLNVSVNGDGNTINNMKWYTDGANGLGTGLGLDVALASAYDQAIGTVGESGSAIDGNHTGLRSAVSSAFDYTSASPLAIDNTVTGTATTGEIGDYVINQINVSATAEAGASTSETMTYQYDES